MNERQAVIYRDVMEACDAILAATKGMKTGAVGAALVMSMVAIAHDENRYEYELIMSVSRVITGGWVSFTRANIMEGIRRLRGGRIRRCH